MNLRPNRWRRMNDEVARPHRLVLKLSDAEDSKIRAEAAIRKISAQAVLMRAYNADSATAAAHFDMLAQDLLAARRTLVNVAGNINQAVKLEHTRRLEGFRDGVQFEEELRVELARLREVIEHIDDIAGKAEA